MKIAIASDDKTTISHHFGRALGFVVFEIDKDKIINLNETTLEMLRIKDEVIELPRFYRKDIA